MCSFYLHTGCCLSRLLLSELSIWMSTLLLQQVMQQQVSLCLSVSYPLSVFLCVLRLSLSQPLLLSFPQFCLTAIIMCLPNRIHLESTFSTLCRHLYFSRLDMLPLFPTHSDCNGWNGESSLLLSCLSFSIVYCRSLDSVASDQLGENGHFDISHPEMWQRMVLLVNTVHYCLDGWWPRFNLPAPASAKTAHKRDFLTSRCSAQSKLRGCVLFYFLILCSSVSLPLLSTI